MTSPGESRAAVHDALQRFGTALAELDAELDWAGLGASYCEGDAREFFGPELRANLFDAGVCFAEDLERALDARRGGKSLYLGAALAELAPLLCESLVLGREIVWLNLPGRETRELRRALRAVGRRLGCALPQPATHAIERVRTASCDHVWMVSVLTDPDAFPALHDELYARRGGPLATGRGSLPRERKRAAELARELLRCAAPASLLSTTDEELRVLRPIAKELGRALEVPRRGRTSALVGDIVRLCALTTRESAEKPAKRPARKPATLPAKLAAKKSARARRARASSSAARR